MSIETSLLDAHEICIFVFNMNKWTEGWDCLDEWLWYLTSTHYCPLTTVSSNHAWDQANLFLYIFFHIYARTCTSMFFNAETTIYLCIITMYLLEKKTVWHEYIEHRVWVIKICTILAIAIFLHYTATKCLNVHDKKQTYCSIFILQYVRIHSNLSPYQFSWQYPALKNKIPFSVQITKEECFIKPKFIKQPVQFTKLIQCNNAFKCTVVSRHFPILRKFWSATIVP